jgi:DNA-binding response OmpR family regulator
MSQRRVLVVDDEPRILDIVKYFLEQGGFEVEPVTTGEKALAAVRRTPFDIAVLDIVLEKDSGYEVAGKLKKLKNGASLPVLFMSSKVEMADLFIENFEGRAEFLLKPFKKEALLDAIRNLLEGGGRQAHKAGARPRKK